VEKELEWVSDAALYSQVTYFKKWRVMDIKKKALIAKLDAEGANPANVRTSL
jgi:hypothetical protein